MINVEVYLFASLRQYVPAETSSNSFSYQAKENTSIKDLLEQLGIPPRECKQALVNHSRKDWDYQLQDGDRVALFPPIAGG